MFFCVMNTDKPFPQEVADILLKSAVEMLRSKKTTSNIETPVCEGRVTTNGERVPLGTYVGTLFKAEIDAGKISTKVSFIVHGNYAPSGEWSDWDNSLDAFWDVLAQQAMSERSGRPN